MRAGDATHLTYCTNIHPGESWAEVRRNIETHVVAVKARVSPDAPFGLGLRLSAAAARSLDEPRALEEFRALLARHDLYVFTLNGFPYGTFHRARVKESVYEPDWRSADRSDYTARLSRLLAVLLPDGVEGSVSTVPVGFRPAFDSSSSRTAAAERLIDHAAMLVGLERETGRVVRLALEPEPHCVLETVPETVRFFEEHLFGADARRRMAAACGLASGDDAEAALRRHLGVCLDTCHAAVEYEEPGAVVRALRDAGITIAKVQLSAGLQIDAATGSDRKELRRFADDVYLHQVVERNGDTLRRHLDLPDALATGGDGEWRIHFHVPLFRERLGSFRNTQPFLREILSLHRQAPISTHLEVETYTWDVLPAEYRAEEVATAVSREMAWVLDRLEGPT